MDKISNKRWKFVIESEKRGDFYEKTVWEDSKKLEGETVTNVYTGRNGNILHVTWDRGNHFVHIHCKSNGCENQWKENEKTTYEGKFMVLPKEEADSEIFYLEVTCKKCGIVYFLNL